MLKSCSRCGKMHDYSYKCNVNRQWKYKDNEESKLRNKNKWHLKSEEIREASNYLCAICKEEGRYIYNNISVHHIDKLKDRPDRLLDNYNLIALCDLHHKQADNGDIDKEYLFKLAKDREDK